MSTTQKGTRPPAAAKPDAPRFACAATPREIQPLIEHVPGKIYLVDIRRAEAFDAGHIPGARNIPLEDLVAGRCELPTDRLIVIYCGDSTCGLPLWGALELAQRGLSAKYLHGGLEDWCRSEFLVEMTPPPPAPEC